MTSYKETLIKPSLQCSMFTLNCRNFEGSSLSRFYLQSYSSIYNTWVVNVHHSYACNVSRTLCIAQVLNVNHLSNDLPFIIISIMCLQSMDINSLYKENMSYFMIVDLFGQESSVLRFFKPLQERKQITGHYILDDSFYVQNLFKAVLILNRSGNIHLINRYSDS